jgi:hypothetical protein
MSTISKVPINALYLKKARPVKRQTREHANAKYEEGFDN